jgi:hypothetical protein
VVFDDHDVQEVVPPVLKPYTHFVLDHQYEQLYALVTDQSAVRALPVGEIRELKVISPGMPDAGVSLGAVNLIDHSLREIAAGPSDSATKNLYELERWVDYFSDRELHDAVVRHLVSYIRALDTSRTYPRGERLFRADVMRMLVRLTDGRLGDFLTVGGLQLGLVQRSGPRHCPAGHLPDRHAARLPGDRGRVPGVPGDPLRLLVQVVGRQGATRVTRRVGRLYPTGWTRCGRPSVAAPGAAVMS